MAGIGIDFGTATSVAAIAGDDGTTLVEAEGQTVIPSMVAFPPAGGHLVGKEAKYRRPIDAENTIFSVKRIIGQRKLHSSVKQFIAKYPFAFETDEDEYPLFRTRAGAFTATQIGAKILEYVLAAAKRDDSNSDNESAVVIGVPCDFAGHRRRATAQVAELAGFPGAVCVDEPLAIARAYLQDDLDTPRRIAVYDLGGGTFDIAVCEIRGGTGTLIASGGHQYLGGDDIDQICADWVIDEVLQRFRWDIRTSPEATTRLLAQCEQAKITLSRMTSARIKLGAVERNNLLEGHELLIERDQLNKWIVDLVRRTFVVCDDVLSRARLSPGDIDEVFMAGGSTLIPAVHEAVEHYFRKAPRTSDSPDHLVAIGAAIIARELGKPAARPAAPAGEERRQQARIKTSLGVQVKLEGLAEFQRLWARDISRGGLFIAMPNPPKLHSEVMVQIIVADETTLDLTGEVVHRVVSSREGSTAGMGIEFGKFSETQRAELDSLVDKAQQLYGSVRPDAGPGLRVDD